MYYMIRNIGNMWHCTSGISPSCNATHRHVDENKSRQQRTNATARRPEMNEGECVFRVGCRSRMCTRKTSTHACARSMLN